MCRSHRDCNPSSSLATISPDAKYLLVVDVASGKTQTMPVPDAPLFVYPAWMPDSSGLILSSLAIQTGPCDLRPTAGRWSTPCGKKVSNLWLQPLNSSPYRQLTHFTSERISQFAYAPDGSQFSIERGHTESDAVCCATLPTDDSFGFFEGKGSGVGHDPGCSSAPRGRASRLAA